MSKPSNAGQRFYRKIWTTGLERQGEKRDREIKLQSVFFTGNGVLRSLATHRAPKISFRQQPVSVGTGQLGQRARRALAEINLRTIHPNPGPIGRDKREAAKRARMERKRGRRKEKQERRKADKEAG